MDILLTRLLHSMNIDPLTTRFLLEYIKHFKYLTVCISFNEFNTSGKKTEHRIYCIKSYYSKIKI